MKFPHRYPSFPNSSTALWTYASSAGREKLNLIDIQIHDLRTFTMTGTNHR